MIHEEYVYFEAAALWRGTTTRVSGQNQCAGVLQTAGKQPCGLIYGAELLWKWLQFLHEHYKLCNVD